MFKRRSKVVFISAILGSLYLLFLLTGFLGLGGVVSGINFAEFLVMSIMLAFIMPHIIITILAVIFNWLAFLMSSTGFAIACTILYALAIISFMLSIVFITPMVILSFIGIFKIATIGALRDDIIF